MPNGNKDKEQVKPKAKAKPKTQVKSKRQRDNESKEEPSKRKKIEEEEDISKRKKMEVEEDTSKRKQLEEEDSSVMSRLRRLRESEEGNVSLHSANIEKDKGSTKIGKAVLGEVEGGLPDQLQRMFRERKVIVVGESHGDLKTRAIEETLPTRFNIGVSYESDTIEASGRNVTPDPPTYRLLHYVEDFYEQLLARKNNHDKSDSRTSHYNLMDAIYRRYKGELDSYGRAAIEDSLYYQGKTLTSYERLYEILNILYKTLELIDKNPGDKGVYDNKLVADNARGLLNMFGRLKTASGNSRDEPVMRKLRSIKMYEALKNDLADAVGKRIYKVGNNHIKDIRSAFGNPAWVIDEVQYKGVLSSLSTKV